MANCSQASNYPAMITSADYGMSPATAQRAVRVLMDEGLVVSRPRGTCSWLKDVSMGA